MVAALPSDPPVGSIVVILRGTARDDLTWSKSFMAAFRPVVRSHKDCTNSSGTKSYRFSAHAAKAPSTRSKLFAPEHVHVCSESSKSRDLCPELVHDIATVNGRSDLVDQAPLLEVVIVAHRGRPHELHALCQHVVARSHRGVANVAGRRGQSVAQVGATSPPRL